jgi:hypothetical protein
MHDVLQQRWKAAGSPVHATEMLLADLQGEMTSPGPTSNARQLLSEAVDYLRDWVTCGSKEVSPAEQYAVEAAMKAICTDKS